MPRLTSAEAKRAVEALPEWAIRGSILERTFDFDDFAVAMGFVVKVAREAEKACHHPDIDIRWNRVRLGLTTHDEGGLTERDLVLAARFSVLADRVFGRKPQPPARRRAAKVR